MFVLEGDEWRRLRKTLRESFKIQRLDTLSRDVTSCAIALSNRLQEFADSQDPVDMNLAFAQYHLASIGKSSFDFDFNALQKFPASDEISEAFEFLLNELPRRSFHPDASIREDYVTQNEDNIKWQRAANSVRKVINKAIFQRLEDQSRYDWEQRGDLLDSMITSYKNSESSDKPELQMDNFKNAETLTQALGDNLVEIFFAGFGTSVVSMCVSLYHLASNPRLMRQAHEEVDSVIPEDLQIGAALSAKNFPFLCRVFLESLRLTPPAPLGARLLTEDIRFNNVKIPTGTVTWVPIEFLHKDPQTWGSNVEAFDPSRFEKPIIPGSFIPFHTGARDCIGRHFAELESVVALAVLLKTYDFEVDPAFAFTPLFTGFGTRVSNGVNKKVCLNLLPRRRTNISAFIYDWTPAKLKKQYIENYEDEEENVGTKLYFH